MARAQGGTGSGITRRLQGYVPVTTPHARKNIRKGSKSGRSTGPELKYQFGRQDGPGRDIFG